MSGVYIHSTNAIHAILSSRVFRGTNKQMQKYGESAEKMGLQDHELHTLFVEWRKGNIAHSVSRIVDPKGDIRGVLVFKDPNGNMGVFGGYPAIFGAEVPLTQLSLRAVMVAEEDMTKMAKTWEDLRTLVRPFAGKTFAFDIENISKIKDGSYVSNFLLSAANSGALY